MLTLFLVLGFIFLLLCSPLIYFTVTQRYNCRKHGICPKHLMLLETKNSRFPYCEQCNYDKGGGREVAAQEYLKRIRKSYGKQD